jgi:hypothetical protein
MKLTLTQKATAENQYGYTDYEGEVLAVPGLIVEMILTIPFDKPDEPYLTFITGTEEARSDNSVSLSITKAQADALINGSL